jgi:hypothetical protein
MVEGVEMIEDYLNDQLDTIEDYTKLREATERIINVFNYYRIKIEEPLPLIIDGKYRITITPHYLEEDDE